MQCMRFFSIILLKWIDFSVPFITVIVSFSRARICKNVVFSEYGSASIPIIPLEIKDSWLSKRHTNFTRKCSNPSIIKKLFTCSFRCNLKVNCWHEQNHGKCRVLAVAGTNMSATKSFELVETYSWSDIPCSTRNSQRRT